MGRCVFMGLCGLRCRASDACPNTCSVSENKNGPSMFDREPADTVALSAYAFGAVTICDSHPRRTGRAEPTTMTRRQLSDGQAMLALVRDSSLARLVRL